MCVSVFVYSSSTFTCIVSALFDLNVIYIQYIDARFDRGESGGRVC